MSFWNRSSGWSYFIVFVVNLGLHNLRVLK